MTGGYHSPSPLDSTELLVPGSGSWRLTTGLLPRPMDSMKIASVANTLFLTGVAIILHHTLFCNFIMSGGWADEAYDEILEFRPDTEDWSLAGHMIEAREGHAVATINFEDVRDVCYD